MRKHALLFVLTFLAVAGVMAFFGWAFFATAKMGTGWKSLLPIWPFVVGGVVATGALAGLLMWLAFYSANHGYDDQLEEDRADHTDG